jgi:hypothetical protein
MSINDDRELLDGFRVPRAPDELEARVLRAATEALASAPTLWDRLWESRPLRATWGVVTTGLIVANVVVSFPRDSSFGKPPVAESSREEIEKIRDAIGFTPIEIGPRAEALVMGTGTSEDSESEPREQPRDNEVQS